MSLCQMHASQLDEMCKVVCSRLLVTCFSIFPVMHMLQLVSDRTKWVVDFSWLQPYLQGRHKTSIKII